ncbi:MAG: hypothetical protein WBQ60_04885 [Asticcacaulis sp.]
MRHLLLIALALSLTACDHKKVPQAEGVDTTFEGSELEKQTIAVEQALIAANPDVAIRDGGALTILHKGDPITTYRNDPKGCQRYFLTGVLKLRGKDGDPYPVAGVTCHFGNTENTYLVLPNSDKFVVYDEASASPDGRVLASGLDRANKNQGELILAEWPHVRDVVTFPAHCKNMIWQGPEHLTATCWHNDGPDSANPYDSFVAYFKADIQRDKDGLWQMQAVQWLDRDSLQPIASKKPFFHFTAAPPPKPEFNPAT